VETRRRILDAALEAFADGGFEQTTVAQIRARSGVSNGALFHHFASKEAIADALYVEAIASFHAGIWELVRGRPGSLRAAVRGTISHQLEWVEGNQRLAKLVYARDQLDPDSASAATLSSLNRELASAWREWMAPLQGLRFTSMVVISAIVGGPAHAIARRWLAGNLDRSPTTYVEELTDAAVAGLTGTPAPGREPRPASGRMTIELFADDGAVVARGEACTQLRRS
jgi:AcrR family transcriptional regulator